MPQDTPLGRSVLALFPLAALVGACGDGGEPRWVHLAASSGAKEPIQSVRSVARSYDVRAEDAGVWLVTEIGREDWTRGEDAGRWELLAGIVGIGRAPAGAAPCLLTTETGAFEYEPDVGRLAETVGRFSVLAGRVLLQLRTDEEPPAAATLWIAATHQVESPKGRHLIAGRRFAGEGCVVWPGESLELLVHLPPESALTFATTVEAALTSGPDRAKPHTFEVLRDGTRIFEYEQRGKLDTVEWHTVPLPRGGRNVRLTFRVSGPFAYTAFASPVIGPADVGSRAARPWGNARPDIVVFLADTFRADNMTAYGGKHGLTPNLDRLAGRGRLFRNARSVSTHTLPAHSTMFSGLFPRQSGQIDRTRPLPEAIDTVAEYFSRSGYRTAAVTDGIMVSQTHGLAQGFSWFDERRTRRQRFDSTLERVRKVLEDDDGRPLFLFVQTYAVHSPYEVRPDTAKRLGGRFDLEHDFKAVLSRLERVNMHSAAVDVGKPGVLETVNILRDLYLGAVADLDERFPAFIEMLEESNILPEGYLIFTSDHGEAFCEHEVILHAGVPHEEQLRVPLVLLGRDVEPGLVEPLVSLVDIAPTLADMAGLPPLEAWMGASLLSPVRDRPAFAFQCRDATEDSTLAVIDGSRKLIGYENAERRREGRWLEAFDLERDPLERENLLEGDESWPREMGAKYASTLEMLLRAQVGSEAEILTADQLQEMRALGYGGE